MLRSKKEILFNISNYKMSSNPVEEYVTRERQ